MYTVDEVNKLVAQALKGGGCVAVLAEQAVHADDWRLSLVHHAIATLRAAALEDAYTAVWQEWGTSEDAALWAVTVSDGLSDEPR